MVLLYMVMATTTRHRQEKGGEKAGPGPVMGESPDLLSFRQIWIKTAGNLRKTTILRIPGCLYLQTENQGL